MTRLRILSDLHLEFGALDLTYRNEDVLVLAGDIDLGTRGARWAAEYAAINAVPVMMIAGNHEFYHGVRGDILSDLQIYANSLHPQLLTFLDNSEAIVAGVRFIGSTLWTDYRLGGLSEIDHMSAMFYAGSVMNDHVRIQEQHGVKFLPRHAANLHARSVGFFRAALGKKTPSVTPLVVLTHHLPSARSIALRYTGDPANPAFASDLDNLVAASGAALWVHGHTHATADYMIGGTRVLCNPRGYTPHDLNPDFDPDLIVEI